MHQLHPTAALTLATATAAAMGLGLSSAHAAAHAATHAATRGAPAAAAPDSVTVNSATVTPEGKVLLVSTTYTCQITPHPTTVAAVVGQPPRSQAGGQAGKAPKYERIGVGALPAVCDGKPHTVFVPVLPMPGFTDNWKAGTTATVGANLMRTTGLNKVSLQARDSKDKITLGSP
ncbi:hypothetical protein ACIBF1_21630 [Spirillospora sp. NPDC050679]